MECFGVDKNRWSGLRAQCKECREKERKIKYDKDMGNPVTKNKLRDDNLRWQSENREKVRQYCRNWYAKNQEYCVSKATEWKNENKDRANETQRRLRSENPERYSEYNRQKYEKHKDQCSDYARMRQARMRAAEGKCSVQEWRAIVARQEGKCNACGRDDKPLTVDHIVPIIKGGSCWPENIQGLCLKCNTKKGSKMMDEFLAILNKKAA